MTKVLVTGASGFVASHCILDLLRNGYDVRGTVRHPDRKSALRDMLTLHCENLENLELVTANLTDSKAWSTAVAGCDAVMHIASPVPTIQPKNELEVIGPAKEGTMNVMTAAHAEGINNIVVTSSVAAVMGSKPVHNKTYTAEDWSDPDDTALIPYAKSKTIAEKAAWDFAEQHELVLSTINPALVLGPALESDYGSSLEAISKLLKGEAPLLPRFGFEIVDVRDVAILHRLALEAAVPQRYLAGNGFRWFIDIANTLRAEFPDNRRIPSHVMPNWLTRVVANFIREMGSFIEDLDAVKHIDCSPAHHIGWQPRSPEEAILDGARSLIQYRIV